MFDPREFIQDFMAVGHTYEEALAMAREEVTTRLRTAKVKSAEYERNRADGVERRPIILASGGKTRRRKQRAMGVGA